jgi:hypothetical protein
MRRRSRRTGAKTTGSVDATSGQGTARSAIGASVPHCPLWPDRKVPVRVSGSPQDMRNGLLFVLQLHVLNDDVKLTRAGERGCHRGEGE